MYDAGTNVMLTVSTMYDLHQQILRLDACGMPVEWLDYREVARLYAQEQIAYAWGQALYCLHGGINASSGRQSILTINAIIATRERNQHLDKLQRNYLPPLSNNALFGRDDHLCLYCGNRFNSDALSRDHVQPLSQGGKDRWTNVVTACKRCNNRKAGRTPEQAGMTLLAIPFTPNHAEYIFLRGRRVLSDQMAFLKAHFPRGSPLRTRRLC